DQNFATSRRDQKAGEQLPVFSFAMASSGERDFGSKRDHARDRRLSFAFQALAFLNTYPVGALAAGFREPQHAERGAERGRADADQERDSGALFRVARQE